VPKELAELLFPEEGRPVGLIQIPRIGVNKIVVEGTAIEDLKNGPGHFNGTPLPGQSGNAAIAGHRTTYGAPFGDIDQLEVGDEIKVTTILGEATYEVAGQRIVDPSQVEVVGDFGDNRLTLTACHPKYSAAKRIVVWATLVGTPVPTVPNPTDTRTVELPGDPATTLPPETTVAPTVPDATTTLAPTTVPVTTEAPTTTVASLDAGDGQGLSGDPDAWPPTLAWGALCVAIALVAWVVGKQWERRSGRSWARRYTVYLAASPLFLGCLYSCFVHVDRLLPAY
jgi:sortase A